MLSSRSSWGVTSSTEPGLEFKDSVLQFSVFGFRFSVLGNSREVVMRAARSMARKVLPDPEGPARRTIFPRGRRFSQSQFGGTGGRLDIRVVAAS